MHCWLQLTVPIVTIATEVVSIKFSIVTRSSLDRHDHRDGTSFYLHDCGDLDRHDCHLKENWCFHMIVRIVAAIFYDCDDCDDHIETNLFV